MIQEGIAAIDASHLAGRPDQRGELDRRVAEAAAHIQDPVARPNRQGREDRLAVVREPADQDMLEADEFRCQHLVPELDEGRVFVRLECGNARIGHRVVLLLWLQTGDLLHSTRRARRMLGEPVRKSRRNPEEAPKNRWRDRDHSSRFGQKLVPSSQDDLLETARSECLRSKSGSTLLE
jgi:hypothetical protein